MIINITTYNLLGTYIEEWEKQTIIHDLFFFQLWVPMLLELQIWMIRPSKLNYQILIPARTNFDDLQNL